MPHATILLAEDAAHFRRLCVLMLEPCGYQVLEAGDGPEAVAMYRHHRPDVVCLDIGMPGGGMEALLAIKAADAGARVMMLTGRRDLETVKRALAAGAVDYIVKPFSRERLLAAIERLLPRDKVPR